MSTVQERPRLRPAAAARRPGFALVGDLVLALVVLALLATTPLLHSGLAYLGSAFTTDVSQILTLVVPGS
jgi:hypothetical protein